MLSSVHVSVCLRMSCHGVLFRHGETWTTFSAWAQWGAPAITDCQKCVTLAVCCIYFFTFRSHIKAVAASPSAAVALKDASSANIHYKKTTLNRLSTTRPPVTICVKVQHDDSTTTSCKRAADTIRELACNSSGELQGTRVWSLWQTYSSILH